MAFGPQLSGSFSSNNDSDYYFAAASSSSSQSNGLHRSSLSSDELKAIQTSAEAAFASVAVAQAFEAPQLLLRRSLGSSGGASNGLFFPLTLRRPQIQLLGLLLAKGASSFKASFSASDLVGLIYSRLLFAWLQL